MRLKIGIQTLVVLFFVTFGIRQVIANDNSTGTAYTMEKGQVQVGFFAPLQMVFSDSIEWKTHPLLFVLMPNLELKLAHKSIRKIDWATEHSFFSPTYLMRQVTREGTGGFISPEFSIPQMAAIYNGIVLSQKISQKHILSLSAGFQFAIKSGKLDKRTSIDLPFIYPRLAVFYSGYQFITGVNATGNLSDRWGYRFSVSGFWAEDYALENNAFISWSNKGKTQLRLGYFLSYAQYPFGTQAHLFFPTLDIVWRFKNGWL